MKTYTILVFSYRTEIENALKSNQYFKTKMPSSEGTFYCNFLDDEIYILPYVAKDNFLDNNG